MSNLCSGAKRNEVQPLSFLEEDDDSKILLVLLNQPIKIEVLKKLKSKAVFTVVCDGAANRLLKCRNNPGFTDDMLDVDVLCGDFDSLKASSRMFFDKKGCPIVYLEDQDETDFTKGTRHGIQTCTDNNIQYDIIVAYPAMGGRFDQTFANVNTLCKLQTTQQFFMISHTDVACLLPVGTSEVAVKEKWIGHTCALIPVVCPIERVSTEGLKYNVENAAFAFGSLVSTSNSIAASSMTITSSSSLLWIVNHHTEDDTDGDELET